MTLNEWFAVTTIASLAIISPGPGFAIVVKNSLTHGRQAGLATAIGNAFGDMMHVALNILGIGLLLSNSPAALDVIRMTGALYLFWLGIRGLRSQPKDIAEIPIVLTAENRYQAFCDGLLTTLLNPKAFIFVFALFSVVVSAETPLYHKAFYGGWIGLISVSWFAIVAIFFTEAKFMGKFQAYRHWFERMTGLILIAFSLSLLFSQ